MIAFGSIHSNAQGLWFSHLKEWEKGIIFIGRLTYCDVVITFARPATTTCCHYRFHTGQLTYEHFTRYWADIYVHHRSISLLACATECTSFVHIKWWRECLSLECIYPLRVYLHCCKLSHIRSDFYHLVRQGTAFEYSHSSAFLNYKCSIVRDIKYEGFRPVKYYYVISWLNITYSSSLVIRSY